MGELYTMIRNVSVPDSRSVPLCVLTSIVELQKNCVRIRITLLLVRSVEVWSGYIWRDQHLTG